MTAALEFADLSVSFPGRPARLRVLEEVGFSLAPGEIVGLVGESGSGKSVTALAGMRLLPEGARVDSGAVRLGGRDLQTLSKADMLRVRGAEIAMIFQEPMTSLNPLFRAGFQIGETLEAHLGLSRAPSRERAGSSTISAWDAPNFGCVAATKVPRPTAASSSPSWVTIW